MKKIKIFLLFIFLHSITSAAIRYVTDPGDNVDIVSNVNTAVSAAVDGDIVELPDGIFKVSTSDITISKKIILRGAVGGSTILYRDEAYTDAQLINHVMITFNINSRVPCGVEVYGLELRSQIPLIVAGDGGSLAKDVGLRMVRATGFKVRDCIFKYFGNGGLEIDHYDDLASGLVYNNQFYRNSKGTDGLELGYGVVVYGESNKWIDDPGFGTANFIFIENNTFDWHRHHITSAACALVVFRYNLVRFSMAAPPYMPGVDVGHQAREFATDGNRNGTRAAEFYGNKVINTTRTNGTTPMANGCPDDQIEELAFVIQQGDALVYNDTVSGFRFAVGFNQNESTTYPYPYVQQTGSKSGKRQGRSGGAGTDLYSAEGDVWVWNINFTPFTLTGGGSCQLLWNYTAAIYGGPGVSTDYVAPGRDYKYNVGAKPLYKAYTYPHPGRSMKNLN